MAALNNEDTQEVAIEACPVISDDKEYPCSRTSREIMDLLLSQQKQLTEHATTLKDVVKTVNATNANMSAVVENQKAISQHLFNLEKRYAQLDCLQTRRPDPELKVVEKGES